MTYSIGEFARLVNVKEHTLRFYEKEGLIQVDRDKNNIRIFHEEDRGWVEFLLHMKGTGMSIVDLKQYTEWRAIGDATLQDRLHLLRNQKMAVEVELAKFLQNLDVLNHKIDYYEEKISKQQLT